MNDRTVMIAGNWKMNLNLSESVDLVKTISNDIKSIDDVDVLIAPPFTCLATVKKAIENSRILLAAQNMY